MMEIRKPEWLKISLPGGIQYQTVKSVLQQHHLHTVCDEARCPNKEECWSKKTATFMILGDICTRNCRFCAVHSAKPTAPDPQEPSALAEAVALLGLDYVVITCVTRDDLPDGGAFHWAQTIREVRKRNPDCRIEILISDLQGNLEDLDCILDSGPDVLAHNLETVEALYSLVRPQADYSRSLSILKHANKRGFLIKSGIMLGLGEKAPEVEKLMRDCVETGLSIFTMGQYLQPGRQYLSVQEYIRPECFDAYRKTALKIGLPQVISGPLVRSSYKAKEAFEHLFAMKADEN